MLPIIHASKIFLNKKHETLLFERTYLENITFPYIINNNIPVPILPIPNPQTAQPSYTHLHAAIINENNSIFFVQ